ncbi:YebC/PmpR family DNA-binding transcriptional regulator [Oceanirhabdus sp. W0125-5]|uniref:YebC/PmpR family DNA-binding transcriptional regulator n=1 Tax=Oceanirhabdus sp. W0125-5 TaxID=2999116 RepID=UPI0022F2C559|nr:YebC/PmpR family DNA-binding transcriptional regulator [Oceanirhabdus sp. W0125-5]WBW99480.1 YebC/PmpR family DNA-binding transcriptional regulator [Oceanirhabdus sp. W0125-5]
MAGHSKWKNIAARKGKVDAKRGKIFTKIGKELAVAVKAGGANPDANARLRDIIAKAKSNNMPKDSIEKAIKKAAGDANAVNFDEIIYEGYGPNGIAVLVEVLTDNKNRSAASARHAYSKHGGNMGSTGCVSFMFHKKGEIVIEKKDGMDEDELMMLALDAGAEDLASEEEVFVITTEPSEFGTVRETLEENGVEYLEAEIKYIPDTYTAIDEETAGKFQKMLDQLEDDEDVQNVYHNAEFPEGWEE